MLIPGLRVVMFNVPPIAYLMSAGCAAQTANKLVLVMTSPGAILDHNNTSMVIAVGDGAVRVAATRLGEA